jgi:hypothetical protein
MASEKTANLVRKIKDIEAGKTFHPSILQPMRGRNGAIPAAIKIAKDWGFIEVAYLNVDNRPVYKRTTLGKGA